MLRSHLEQRGVCGIAPSLCVGPAASPPLRVAQRRFSLEARWRPTRRQKANAEGTTLRQTAKQRRERERKRRYRHETREKKRIQKCRRRATMGCVGNQIELGGGVESVDDCEGALYVLRVTVTEAAMVDPMPRRSLPLARKRPKASLSGASVPERGYIDTRRC